jgi:hypothetical protein
MLCGRSNPGHSLAWSRGRERVVRALRAALKDEDEEVRWSAPYALTQSGVDLVWNAATGAERRHVGTMSPSRLLGGAWRWCP